MTVVADEKNCVPLPTARPGEKFDLQLIGADKIVLTRLDAEPGANAEIRLIKKDGYTVATGGKKVDEAVIKELLREFP